MLGHHLGSLLFEIEDVLLFLNFEVSHRLLHLHLELVDGFSFLGRLREKFLILLQVGIIGVQLFIY